MSRAPPFPTTRQRSPSVTNGNPYLSQPLSAPGTSNSTRPLQIPRPGSRPTTPMDYPSNSPSYSSSSSMPTGPSRPQRSELRSRVEYAGSQRASTSSQDPYSRDSIDTRSDVSGSQYRNVPSPANMSISINGPPPRQRPPRLKSPVSEDGNQTTPTSLTSALSAFQSAGTKRRQTVDDDDYQYQKERELEIEAEKARQQRIRDRAPGIRKTARGGEIDGTYCTLLSRCAKLNFVLAVLDQVKDGWEFVIDPNVRAFLQTRGSNTYIQVQFNTVDLALQLLDKSSLGKNMDSFRRTKNMLSKALKGSVDSRLIGCYRPIHGLPWKCFLRTLSGICGLTAAPCFFTRSSRSNNIRNFRRTVLTS